MKVKSESEVAQSRLTLLDPMDCSLPGSSVHGSFQARVLEWVAIAVSVFVSEYLLFVTIGFRKSQGRQQGDKGLRTRLRFKQNQDRG